MLLFPQSSKCNAIEKFVSETQGWKQKTQALNISLQTGVFQRFFGCKVHVSIT